MDGVCTAMMSGLYCYVERFVCCDERTVYCSDEWDRAAVGKEVFSGVLVGTAGKTGSH